MFRGILCLPSLETAETELEDKFDAITMWHILEHLENPQNILKRLSRFLSEDEKIIIEVPNANDALLSLYGCKAFQNFTYWEYHLYLYTMETLKRLLNETGFHIDFITQAQRYPLSNQLYWLTNGIPGGHAKCFF